MWLYQVSVRNCLSPLIILICCFLSDVILPVILTPLICIPRTDMYVYIYMLQLFFFLQTSRNMRKKHFARSHDITSTLVHLPLWSVYVGIILYIYNYVTMHFESVTIGLLPYRPMHFGPITDTFSHPSTHFGPVTAAFHSNNQHFDQLQWHSLTRPLIDWPSYSSIHSSNHERWPSYIWPSYIGFQSPDHARTLAQLQPA